MAQGSGGTSSDRNNRREFLATNLGRLIAAAVIVGGMREKGVAHEVHDDVAQHTNHWDSNSHTDLGHLDVTVHQHDDYAYGHKDQVKYVNKTIHADNINDCGQHADEPKHVDGIVHDDCPMNHCDSM